MSNAINQDLTGSSFASPVNALSSLGQVAFYQLPSCSMGIIMLILQGCCKDYSKRIYVKHSEHQEVLSHTEYLYNIYIMVS